MTQRDSGAKEGAGRNGLGLDRAVLRLVFALAVGVAACGPAAAQSEAPAADAPAAAGATAAPEAEAALGESAAPIWGYDAATGPARWGDLSVAYARCGIGAEQSPIDIQTARVAPSTLPPVEILWERFVPEVVDTGRTILVRANGAGGSARLDGVDYRFEHIQFRHRSEHMIDGKPAEMEAQFVHRSEAGGFLIVAALIRPGAANVALEAYWPLVPDKGASRVGDTPVDPRALLPTPATEYRYAGSLTTPPCTETVTWSVRAEPITASEAQIATFAAFYPNNARPPQAVGRRFVLRRE